jgi:hypothetical protein
MLTTILQDGVPSVRSEKDFAQASPVLPGKNRRSGKSHRYATLLIGHEYRADPVPEYPCLACLPAHHPIPLQDPAFPPFLVTSVLSSSPRLHSFYSDTFLSFPSFVRHRQLYACTYTFILIASLRSTALSFEAAIFYEHNARDIHSHRQPILQSHTFQKGTDRNLASSNSVQFFLLVQTPSFLGHYEVDYICSRSFLSLNCHCSTTQTTSTRCQAQQEGCCPNSCRSNHRLGH